MAKQQEQGTRKTKSYTVNEKDRDLIERFVALSEGCPATIIGESYDEISDRTIQGYRRTLESKGREGLPLYLEGKTRWTLRRFVADAEAGKLPDSVRVRLEEARKKGGNGGEPAKPRPKTVPVTADDLDVEEPARPAFKEGDRVKYRETGNTVLLRGEVGTVKGFPVGAPSGVSVEWDECRAGFADIVHRDNLERLPEDTDNTPSPEEGESLTAGEEEAAKDYAETWDEIPEIDFAGAERGKYADRVPHVRPEGPAEAGSGPAKRSAPLYGAEVHILRRLTLIERSQRRTESLLNDVLDILLAERKGR